MGHGAFGTASGAAHETLFHVAYPDLWSEFGITAPLGDLDGDGHDEVAFGDANYNLPAWDDGACRGTDVAPDLRALSLAEALELESKPCSISWESGCVRVYSGRTRKVVLGIWGTPGSHQGMGLAATGIPDVTGDGRRDLVVGDGKDAYVYSGSGAALR